MRIGVNCGHTISGTIGCGAVGYLNESDETRAVGYKLMDMLKKQGHTVYDCTNDIASSVTSNLENICTLANAQYTDLFVSIHLNAGGGKGSECYTYGEEQHPEAVKICENLERLGFVNRGAKNGSHLKVINSTNAKAILVEVCFVDTDSDANLYHILGAERVAAAIYEGITGEKADNKKEVSNAPKTVYSLNDVHVQVIDPWNFSIKRVDKSKKDINEQNYANAGFFGKSSDSSTIPVGNLVIDGKVITEAGNQPDWLNTFGKRQTTLIVHNNNDIEFVEKDNVSSIPDVKYAISGIPIIRNGYKVSMDDIKAEGYFGNECYDTWHGFIGIRDNRLVYVAAKLDFKLMVYLLEVLGIKDAIKLDGGGSFILHNGAFEVATTENRRIDNIIVWEG